MSNVYDMHAKALEIGDEVDIPCKVIALHQFEDVAQAQVTVKTRHPRSGTKNEYTTFNVDARQVSRTTDCIVFDVKPSKTKPHKFKATMKKAISRFSKAANPKLCPGCQRHPSACTC